MEPLVIVFLLLFMVVLVASPIVAVAALVRVRRLEKGERRPHDPQTMRLDVLAERVAALERTIAERPTGAARATPEPPQREPPEAAAALPPAPPSKPAASHGAPMRARPVIDFDLESAIGGRWLHRVGLAAIFLAAAFFLKYAFDNDWIGPAGQLSLLLLVGSGLLVFSEWLLRRGLVYFSEGMAGLGAGVLYLSLEAGWDYYQLLPSAVAFAGMVAVTVAVIVLAVGRESQRVALIGLVGGFATPTLLATGGDHQLVLFAYVAVLNAGVLVLARARGWRAIEIVAFAGTLLYFYGWYVQFYDTTKLLRTSLFATLFYTQLAALPVLRARRTPTLPSIDIFLVLANALWYLAALREMLWPQAAWTLTLAMLALAAAHLLVAQTAPAPRDSSRPWVRLLFAGLALTLVTLAIPAQFEGRWITMAWAVEGLVLIATGLRAAVRPLRWAGLALFALVALRLVMLPIPADALLWNARFAAFATAVVCFAAAFYLSRRYPEALDENERVAFAQVGLAINVLALLVLSLELWDHFGRMHEVMGFDPHLARQLSLSLLWTLYASGLMVLGVRYEQTALRWQALALFLVVVAKVFLYDLSFLERIYRVVSFVVLGVVLLVVSFIYQRKLVAKQAERSQP